MKNVYGNYNELRYVIFEGEEQIYEAGNSPFDSQGYVDKSEGVGLEKMKEYCELTARDKAKELNLPFGGVFFEGEEV